MTIGSTTLVNGLEGVTNRSDGVNVTRDAGGNLLELRNGNGTTSANSAYTLDGLGSTIALTDSTGTTDTALYTYQPYGTTASSSGTLATTNPFRYASGYQMTTPSMYHFGDRYYNQAVNRWTQRDSVAGSITDPASTDRYEYSGGDPINHVDITGMYWTSEAAQNGGSLNGAALASACVNGFAVGAIATGGDPLGGAVGCASSMLLESAEVAPTNTDWPISSGNVIRLAGGLSDAWNIATSVF